MYLAIVTFAWIAAAVIFGAFGAWIAFQRDRPAAEGLILGALFGPLGVLVELFLPQGVARPIPQMNPRPAPPKPSTPPPTAPRPPVTRPAKPSRVGRPIKPIDDDQLL